MPHAFINVDFSRINPLDGSRTEAFEEFGCQLAAAEPVPEGSVYQRFRGAGGDGGVECVFTRPDRTEWGFQTKLIGFDSVKKQAGHSFAMALKNRPALTRYTILVPFDPTGPVPGRRGKSESEKLEKYVEEWTELARRQSREVRVEFWFRSGLLDRLLKADPSGGRVRFWFGATVMDRGWFTRHAEERVAALSPSYRPPLDEPAAVEAALAALGRGPRWEQLVRKQRHWARRGLWYVHEAIRDGAPGAEELAAQLREVDALLHVCETTPTREALDRAATVLQAVSLRRTRAWAEDTGAAIAPAHGVQVSVIPVHRFLESDAARLAGERAMLLTGESGVGKTHALCTEVRERSAAGLPSVLLSGADFRGEPAAWTRIRDALGLPGDVGAEALFDMLDVAGRRAGHPAVIFIDALNDTQPDRAYWQRALPGLMAQLAPYEWVRLCVSCRTSYLEAVLGSWRGIPRIEHGGIAGPEAYLAFFEDYGLEAPAMPPLGPEATNPGFLHLLCEAARAAGKRTVAARRDGMAQVIAAVLEARNTRISRALGLIEAERLVQAAARALAAAMPVTGGTRLPLADAVRAVAGACGDRALARRLLDEMIREDLLLVEQVAGPGGEPCGEVRFAFERLGDHLRVREVLEGRDAHAVRQALAPGGALHALVADEPSVAAHRGTLEALAVQIPEATGAELTEVAPPAARRALRALVLSSLPWRTAGSVGRAARDAVEDALASADLAQDALAVLFSIGAREGHPLGADWLHGWLAARPLPERDLLLLPFLEVGARGAHPVERLLLWAREGRIALADRETEADRETARLATLLTAWACCACDTTARDDATLGLARLFEAFPALAPGVIERFAGAGDEYAVERHLQAACAALLRKPDGARAGELAAVLARHWGNPLVVHQGIRTCGEAIYALARAAGRPPPYAPAPQPAAHRVAPSPEDVALLNGALPRSRLLPALDAALRRGGHALTPHEISGSVASEMVRLGYTHAHFGEWDTAVFAMAGNEELGYGDPAAAKYLTIAASRLLAVLEEKHLLFRRLFGPDAPEVPPPVPAAAARLVRDLDPTVDGWVGPDDRPDAWWLPRGSPFWAEARGRLRDDPAGWPDAVPHPGALLAAVDPAGGAWRVLWGRRQWDLEDPGAEIEWGRRRVKLFVRGYLAPRARRAEVDAWLRSAAWPEERPSEAVWRGMWVGEYPWRREAGLRTQAANEHCPVEGVLLPAVEWRMSAGMKLRWHDLVVPLPAAPFLEPRQPLSWSADGVYHAPDGVPVLRHPFAAEPGPEALVADPGYLADLLRRKRWDLLWIVDMEDVADRYDEPNRGEVRGRMSWAFRLARGEPVLVATAPRPFAAARKAPEPATL